MMFSNIIHGIIDFSIVYQMGNRILNMTGTTNIITTFWQFLCKFRIWKVISYWNIFYEWNIFTEVYGICWWSLLSVYSLLRLWCKVSRMFDNCCHICSSSLSLLTGQHNVNRVVKAIIVIFCKKSYCWKGIFANNRVPAAFLLIWQLLNCS